MVTVAVRGKRIQSGLRSFDPYRDLRSVTDLVSRAFGDQLDPGGRVVLAEMRRLARWGALLWWLHGPALGSVAAPGFVWVEHGQVVGNVSLRRAFGGQGVWVGNVAVHPDWQGRGIGRSLMVRALEESERLGASWVALEVRVGNTVARRLYDQLGFREIGQIVHMLRPEGMTEVALPSACSLLRSARRRDGQALGRLAARSVSQAQRCVMGVQARDYQVGWERWLDLWLEGRREFWWVMEEAGQTKAAVRALRERGHRLNRLEVLIPPEQQGRFESILVRQAVSRLCAISGKAIEAMLPVATDPLLEALDASGFQRLRVLAQMKLTCPR